VLVTVPVTLKAPPLVIAPLIAPPLALTVPSALLEGRRPNVPAAQSSPCHHWSACRSGEGIAADRQCAASLVVEGRAVRGERADDIEGAAIVDVGVASTPCALKVPALVIALVR